MKKLRFSKLAQYVLHNCIFIPPIIRFFNKDYAHCNKCGLTWNWCKSKSVKTSEFEGTFATCDICWNNSTLEELNKYYTKTYLWQKSLSNTPMDHTLEYLLKCVKKEYNLKSNKVNN
jgi:hypothetical protein